MTQINKIYGITIPNTSVTGFTYDGNNNITLSQNNGTSYSVAIDEFSGITVNGGFSANTIYSGSTNLYDIFGAGGGDVTRVQPGTNITTGGTDNYPIINVVNSPSFNQLTTSGLTIINANIISTGNTSGTTIDGISYFDFFNNLNPKPLHIEGRLFYDYSEHTMSIYNDEADVTHQLGQEGFIRVYNNSGSLISNGKAVYVSGSEGTEGRPTIDLAIATASTKSGVIGLSTHDIEDSSFGYVTNWGIVNDVNTSLYSAGDLLYLSETIPGGYTASTPSSTASTVVQIGKVTKVDASTGRLLIGINTEGAPGPQGPEGPAGSGETNTVSTVGLGNSIFKQKVGVDFQFRSLSAGTNITLVTGDTITINSTATSGGSSRTTGSTQTTNATPTTIATIATTTNATNLIEVYVKAYQTSATNYGVWKRTLTVTNVSGTPTIQLVNSDVTKTSSGLKATSVTFSVSGSNILVQVTGIDATTIDWNSAYEKIL